MMRHLMRLVTLCALTCAVTADSTPKVTTQSGDLIGAEKKSYFGRTYFSFLGIPYAEPPLDAMRFRPPQPHQGWTGVREALAYGDSCMQLDLATKAIVGSEDCLFLNVFTPNLPKEGEALNLPVMVWIHGGGFAVGSGDSTFHGPDYLMDQEVVIVTINYRLGPFGFLTTGDASAPGNYGMHDQVLALEWVQANIVAFGGDPGAVTIFGESAGGATVGLHVLSPRSKGLFARAISQSGASVASFGAGGPPQGKAAKIHAEVIGCPTSSTEELVGCMRSKPAMEVCNGSVVVAMMDPMNLEPMIYGPRVDPDSHLPFMPHDPHVIFKSGGFNTVPWMMGFNQNEGVLYTAFMSMNPDAVAVYSSHNWTQWASSLLFLDDVTEDPAAMAETIYRFYFGDKDCNEETLQNLANLISDRLFTVPIVSESDLASPHTSVFMYVLDNDGPGRQSFLKFFAKKMGMPDDGLEALGVPHCEDTLYLFRPANGPAISPDSEQHKMIRFMVSVWTNFARHGYPSSDVLSMPSWPAYKASEQNFMRLNMAPSVDSAPFRERVEFMRSLKIQESWRVPLSQSSCEEL